jgi:Ras-related protein Rab-8A
VIDTERGKQLADEFKIKFLETSAKNSLNVDEAFITLAKDIKKRLIDTEQDQPPVTEAGFKPTAAKPPTGRRPCCG